MPRKKLIITKNRPYHVTNRSNNREWFYLPMDETWDIFCRILSVCTTRYETEIRSFVLMANHYHLILSTPFGNLSEVVRYLKTESSRAIQKKCGRINHIFGGRYKWSALLSDSAIAYAYKYVARNPVSAGICERVEDYRYSTTYFLNRGDEIPVPIVEGINDPWDIIPKQWDQRLEWLNGPSPKELDKLISNALRRFEFGFSEGNDCRLELKKLAHYYAIPLPRPNTPATFSAEK
jgi:putative transposase